MPHATKLDVDDLPPELKARLASDVSSQMRYFLDLAATVQGVADALKTEAHGGFSCHHPALQADQLASVARHLRTFAVHPDCAAIDALNGPAPAPRTSLEVDSRGSPIPPWLTREEHEAKLAEWEKPGAR